MKIRGSGSSRSPSLSSAAKARLRRIVNRTPEVVVKITGRSRGIVHLKQHLDYITRNGRLLGETQDGTKIATRADVRELHDDWLVANALTERGKPNPKAAQSVGVILSMRAGTPPDRLHEAARTWARESLPNNDWLMVRHEDKDHPHVHVTVRAVGYDGRRLVTGPADLQRWRETFARELRRHGIEAEATPRQARGAVRRSDRPALHRLTERGTEPNVVKRRTMEAVRDASPARSQKDPAWERAVQQRQQKIRDTYLAHASTLEGGDGADRRLALDLRAFAAGLPVPLSRRQTLAASLRPAQPQQEPRRDPLASPIGEPASYGPPGPSGEQVPAPGDQGRQHRRR
ncbi:relaxase/mobilization nuclease domain-containing protein (plasmid) [Lichenicola cladoniae]|uniref:Relaxase/mobilization nuclease domain-containing protein n=1 Tax=Lichenicola cladoniae TaxID=1484109 RepID=A0A6M8I0L6_9PROT|nr:relaxase/mobilization nuclease domain-containing protein [Lichenicola cladoniae]NPD70342.1 relaxase/mobilization nuclease domain-containing protein [Acetobacteraceae bacterium]QKE93998.1 relaxase/mobilization nuclease domain-containing protein [Lichenicola cladoniae]